VAPPLYILKRNERQTFFITKDTS